VKAGDLARLMTRLSAPDVLGKELRPIQVH
jgi:hypothetical protein